MSSRALLAFVLLFACGGTPDKKPVVPAPPVAPVTPTTPIETVTPAAAPVAPVAAQKPHEVKSPHGSRTDPYYWLRDDTRKDPAVLAYLDAENAYAKAVLAPVANVQEALFAEMKGRVKEDDSSVPVFDSGYWYYKRYEPGKQYGINCRRKGTMQAAEQILLDENVVAAGQSFYDVKDLSVSRDGKLLAYTEDTVGREQYVLRIKNLETGALLPESVGNVTEVAWANDNKTVFVVGLDDTTLRADKVWRVTLGSPAVQMFREADAQYYVHLANTKSRRFVAIYLEATTNTEVRLIDADKPSAPARVFLPRSKDHIYQVEHLDGRFVIRTNDTGKNFRLAEVKDGKESKQKNWKDLLAHDPTTFVEDMAVYRGFIGVTVRSGGLSKGLVLRGKETFTIDAQDPAYALSIIDTPDPAATKLRYAYTSPTTPSTIFALDPVTKKKSRLKQQTVPTYDPSQYASEYVFATASDGAQIPVSLAYKKSTPRDGTAPVLVSGYGSYGISTEPRFSQAAVSLLDRGWVTARAHVRGGQEMGRAWYDAGHLMNKKNTFTDFVAASEHLVKAKFAAPTRVYAYGGSAGGLLMGAIANMRPDLYRGIIADVPFVDAVTTMLDPSLPETTVEYDEWGNPNDAEAYKYILSYSPYDNVAVKPYPAMFVKSGLWDSHVQYFEPAKWVAKLRATKTDANPLLLETDMTSGHGGASGRFAELQDVARQYAFLLFVDERPDARTQR